MANDTAIDPNLELSKNRFTTIQDPKKMFGEADTNSDVHPVRLVAFTGRPVKHWWHGTCVFDRSGFKSTSDQITIDYNHDWDEELGYLDKFSGNPELICEGVLLPFGNDRAAQIIHRAKRNRKYQCSVTVDEYLRTECLDEGMVAEVNGQVVEGPITIFREYTIMGVAIGPYVTDKGTAMELFNKNPNLNKEPKEMTKDMTATKPESTTPKADDRSLFKKFQKLFGDPKAAKYFSDGLNEEQAKEQYIEDANAEIAVKDEKIAELEGEIEKKDKEIAELSKENSAKTDDKTKDFETRIAAMEDENKQLRTAAGVFNKSESDSVSGNRKQEPEKKEFSPVTDSNRAYIEKVRSDLHKSGMGN